MNTRHKHVFVLTNAARISGREILRGILRYTASRPEWRIHICEPSDEGFDILFKAFAAGTVDGLITSEMENPKLAALLEKSLVPLAVIGTRATCIPRRKANVFFVTHDETALGSSAAQFFLSLGKFNSCGYVHFRSSEFQFLSQLRETGFSKTMASRNVKVLQYRSPDDGNPDCEKLGKWLAALPKPACVLAGYDKRAADVVHACEQQGIAVPGEIRLLGIDNDEFTCLSMTPTLSSVATDPSQEGFMSAAKINAFLKRRARACKRESYICHTRCEIIPRESTQVLAPGLNMVDRARRFIAQNAGRALTVDEVVAYLRVSRGLAYLRFRQYARQSILTTINQARIEHVKHQLTSSRQSIDSVALSCGFANPNHLKTLFKKMTGITMRDWRSRNAHAGPNRKTTHSASAMPYSLGSHLPRA